MHEPDSSKPGTSESQAPTITGEESEETVFSHEATLFTLENGGWKSRGKAGDWHFTLFAQLAFLHCKSQLDSRNV